MRRSYRGERYLGILDRVRAAMPDAAITTDIIVGFPGETEADFEDTLDVVEQARFASAFTFQYSQAARHAGRDMPGPGPEGASFRSATSGWSSSRPDRVGGEPGQVGARSRCWSPKARDARTTRRIGCPDGRATTGSCISRPVRRGAAG